jgi:Zn-dependent protease with chaperone function
MKYTPRQTESNVNVTPTSPIREFFVLVGGLLGIVILIYILLGLAVNLIVPHISVDLEKKMAAPFIRSMYAQDADTIRQHYVQALIDDLQERCTTLPYHFQVHVRKAPTINALALPGGHIIVFTGLLDKVTSENELAFVLAHEMGHYAHRDHLRGMGRAVVFMTISAFLFGPESDVGRLVARGLSMTEMSFSRSQETQADEFALETLNCAYGHVAGTTDFFEKIQKEHDPGMFGHYFSSHPKNRQRISHLRDISRDRGFKLADRKPLPEAIKQSKDATPGKPSPSAYP